MKVNVFNQIIEKAKAKKDGIYSHKGYRYVVKGGRFMFYADYKSIYQICGPFTTKIGEAKEIYEVPAMLRGLLKGE